VRRDTSINFRVSKELRADLQRLADTEALPLGAFLRRLLGRAVITAPAAAEAPAIGDGR